MKKVSVLLKTGGHCIQTAAKNELRRITDLILESGDDNIPSPAAEQVELLTEFLMNTDFNRLRASDDRFAGITGAECILERNSAGKPVVQFK